MTTSFSNPEFNRASEAAFLPNHTGTGASASRQPQRSDFSLTLSGMMFDLDGNFFASYRNPGVLHDVHVYLEKRGVKPETVDIFFDAYVKEIAYQKLLHLPHKLTGALNKFAHDHGIHLDKSIMDEIKTSQKKSFQLYEGVRECLTLAKEAGIFIGIYTNTPDYFAIKRLCGGGLGAEQFGINAIWAKRDNEHAPLSWLSDKSTALERGYGDILISYEYQKPNATPMLDAMQLGNIASHNMMFMGDGAKDLESVHGAHGEPAGHFFFNAQGAADICEKQQLINERLRPGSEPLGVKAVDDKIIKLGVGNQIVRLNNGFEDLVEMIKAPANATRKIFLTAPERMPFVRNGQLVSNEAVRHNRPQKPASFAHAPK